MAEIKREVSMEMRGVDILTNGLLFTCLIGNCPDGGTVLVISNLDVCVGVIGGTADNISYNSDHILQAILKAAHLFQLPPMKECFGIAREIAEAIEPYLNGGDGNG